LDQGGVMRKETGRDTPRIVRLLIGNPLIMKEMAKHVPDAGSYAPVTVLVDERADGVHLSYDKMESFLAPYGNRDALEVARNLDKKIEDLLRQAAAVMHYLEEQGNIPIYRITTPAGMGTSHEAASNSTLEGRKLNRRVEVTILVNQGV